MTLKIQIFCAVFNCSNQADRKKNKSTVLPQLLKIMAKKA